MSEVDARPPPTRGRSSYRGGRGGFGRGGTRGGRKPVNGTTNDATQIDESLEDQGELGEMKKKYASELVMLKDMFPDWTDVDLVFALQEADGDVPSTVDHITQGNVSQFAEVKSSKDRARSKVKDASTAAGASDKAAPRGGRGRGGFEGSRGARARGSERGRGGRGGTRGGHATTNGATRDTGAVSVPTTESSAWDDTANTATGEGAWDNSTTDVAKDVGDTEQSAYSNVVTSESTPAAASEGMKSSLIPEGGPKKSWASMFQKPAPAPVKKPPPAQSPAEPVSIGHDESVEEQKEELPKDTAPPTIREPLTDEAPAPVEEPVVPEELSADGEELALAPSKDPLTEENVEHLPDESHPPPTHTAASTTGSLDPRNLTPLPSHPAPIARPPLGGYATSAQRAATASGRSASFQRRVQEQQEAVVMPGHNAVDRAAVQFGSMGINGEPGPDVDEDREEPETRQAPQHSPPSQPRTSLPPAPRQTAAAQEPLMSDALPTPKQAPGLPPASQQNQQQIQEAAMAHGMPMEPHQMNPNYNNYGRFAQQGMQQEPAAHQQKPYDPFSHQAQSSQYDQYTTQSQQPSQPQQQPQSSFGGLSSAPGDYSNYYTSDHTRAGYGNYYGASYGAPEMRAHTGQNQQDAGMGQQRSTSGFGTAPSDSAFSSQAPPQVSVQTSLLELNTALESCTNESDKQSIIAEIQRVVSSAQLHGTKPKANTPGGMYASAQNAFEFARAHDSLGQDQLSNSLAGVTDVTNRKFQTQSRFADATGSGQNTPNPLMGGQQQQNAQPTQQSQHSMHQAPSQQQQQQGGYGAAQAGFPYGHPYYNSPYQQAYQAQFGYSNPVPGYGGGYPSKHSGMYGGSHGYGMAPQSSYDQHSASPANASAFGQNQQTSMRSTSGMGSGLASLDEYGRGSAQSHQQSSAFGGAAAGMNDPFARSTSGFGSQSGYAQQQSMAGPEDSLKPFSDGKSGPSPSLGQPGRPGSAANSAAGSAAQSGLPPPQSHQSGFGGYGGFPGQGQYGGLGGLGQQQQQQHGQGTMGGQGQYGSYGASGFGQTYGTAYGSRGGWGSNYGAH